MIIAIDQRGQKGKKTNILPKVSINGEKTLFEFFLFEIVRCIYYCKISFVDLPYSGIPNTKLGTYLENRVNNFLKNKDAGAGDVTIKVLSSGDKVVEVKSGMKSRSVLHFIALDMCLLGWE